jgi:hypothetical protein
MRIPRVAEERDGLAHAEHEEEEGVPLVVTLERLVLGVLPASALPVSALLLLLGMLGSTTVVRAAWVWGAFGEVGERVRRELAVLEESEDDSDRKER